MNNCGSPIQLYIEAGWPLYDYDAKVIKGFAENMPYPDAYFDAVISVNALDHVDDFQKIANERSRETGRRAVLRGGISRTDGHRTPMSDDVVESAFGKSNISKISERGKKEVFSDIAARFNLLAIDLLTSTIASDSRCGMGRGA